MDSLLSRPKSGRKRNYFGKEMSALKLLGVSLTGSEGILYKIYSFVFVSGTIFLYTILDFSEYFKQDFDGIADLISYQIAGIMTCCKVAVVFRNRVSFVKLLAKLEREPFLANSKRGGDKEEELIQECVWITSVQTYTYWIVASLTIISTIIFGIIKRMKNSDYHKFPYGPFSIINGTYSPNYEIIYCYQSISIVFIGGLFSSVDLLLAAVLAHISYQFKILQNNVRRLLELCYEDMMENVRGFEDKLIPNPDLDCEIDGSTIPWKYLKKHIKNVIEYHVAIIDIATEMEEAFSNLFLIVFLGTLALICFAVYGATAFGHNPQLIIRHLGEGICSCLQVATVCYWGEQVMIESQLVGRAANESNFVGTDLRYQKMLALVIRRSQNPTKFTAGKFSDICLTTFTWILRTSYSSFMVLRRSNTNTI